MNRKARRVLALISVILFCTFLSLEFIIMEPWDLFPQIQEEYNASDLTDEHLQPGANPEGARLPATRSGRPSLRHSGTSAVFLLFFFFVPGELLMDRARRTACGPLPCRSPDFSGIFSCGRKRTERKGAPLFDRLSFNTQKVGQKEK